MAALRFLSGSKDVDATLKADIVKIGGFSDDQLASFIKILLRFVCAGGASSGSAPPTKSLRSSWMFFWLASSFRLGPVVCSVFAFSPSGGFQNDDQQEHAQHNA